MIPIFFQWYDTDEGPVFSPPIRGYTEPWRRETREEEKHHLGRFRGDPRAVNVYKLLTGIYTENEGIAPDLISVTYRGSTRTPVTDVEAAALVLAGYTVTGYEP